MCVCVCAFVCEVLYSILHYHKWMCSDEDFVMCCRCLAILVVSVFWGGRGGVNM